MMKKRVPDKFWFPWWPDKWIFGSVRIEFTVAERGIWVDMLSLASKDDGHIRANEETPYPLAQLAGMLIIPEKELDAAINKFIKKTKLTKMKDGTLYVTKWEKYQFSESYHRVQKHREKEAESRCSNGKELQCNEEALPYYNTLNHNTLNHNIIEILNLLSKVKNYPFNKEEDLKFIQALKAEFPDVDVLEKVKQITLNWLNYPLLKKSRARVQIRRWVSNESKWQKEGDGERKVGASKDEHKEKYPMLFLSNVYAALRKQGKDNDRYSKLLFSLADEEAKSAYLEFNTEPEKFIKFLEKKSKEE